MVRIAQLDKVCQDVIGAGYERRKYSAFVKEDPANLLDSDRMSVTRKGNKDFYNTVVRTITDLSDQGLPISTRLKSVLAESRYGLRAAEYCTTPDPNRYHVQPPACWSRFMSICHEVYLVIEAEVVQTWTHLAGLLDEFAVPAGPAESTRCNITEPTHTLGIQPICRSAHM